MELILRYDLCDSWRHYCDMMSTAKDKILQKWLNLVEDFARSVFGIKA